MLRNIPFLFLLFCSMLPAKGLSAILYVGPDRQYKTVRTASEAVQDGDIVEIDCGIYSRDVATWRKNNVTVRAIGGRVHLRADGSYEGKKAIWVVQGGNFTVEGIEFSGASVPDRNGAGIRVEAPGLIMIRNCYFHDNENGILTWNEPDSEVIIENSTFENNGYGDGQSHNMYIGRIRSFILRGCYSHKARIGHNVKSRARNNYIYYNRIMDEDSGIASYQIDLPEGGRSFIIGNIIQQGRWAINSAIISYAAENALSGVLSLYVINNTIVNDRPNGGIFLKMRIGTIARIINNIFYGPGTAWTSEGTTVIASNNYREPEYNNSPKFVNPQGYNYRIFSDSPCVNAGTLLGVLQGIDLMPRRQYLYDAQSEPRVIKGNIDIGAFEALRD